MTSTGTHMNRRDKESFLTILREYWRGWRYERARWDPGPDAAEGDYRRIAELWLKWHRVELLEHRRGRLICRICWGWIERFSLTDFADDPAAFERERGGEFRDGWDEGGSCASGRYGYFPPTESELRQRKLEATIVRILLEWEACRTLNIDGRA